MHKENKSQMEKRGRSINIFLMDGESTGKIKVSISNWNGVTYKIPRKMLEDCRDFEAFKQSGIYFLFGENRAYIGQADVRLSGGAIFKRIFEHTKDHLTADWQEVVVFTRKDNSLGLTDISFLENLFHKNAVKANRYKILNSNRPSQGTVTEEKRSELEEYADYAELILGVLGYKIFEPIEQDFKHAFIKKSTEDSSQKTSLPNLPNPDSNVGEYIRTAMRNLANSGYSFSDEEIDKMCSEEWTWDVFKRNGKPFMRRIKGTTPTKDELDINGYRRFWNEVFIFGNTRVIISKEWFPIHKQRFIEWYNSLSK